MPYTVQKDTTGHCSASKPWSVTTQGDPNAIHGCFATKAEAQKQQRALYANLPASETKAAAPEVPMHTDEAEAEDRAQLTSAAINDLPDSDFAYIEPGGTKDDDGKTVPRSKRHFPINDPAHVRNALARAPQSPFGAKAMPKILAAAKKFGVDATEKKSASGQVNCPTCEGTGQKDGKDCADCDGSGTIYSPKSKGLRSLTPNMVEWRRRKAPKNGERENRSFLLDSIELREDGDSGVLELTGYASVTGVDYRVGPFDEQIAPKAFKRSLANPSLDVCLLANHSDLPIARTTNGSLQLSEDSHGLRVEAQLDPNDPDVQRLEPKLRSGLLTEMSFAFRVPKNGDEWSEDRKHRLIKQVELHRGDVSIVTNGASQATSVQLRAEDVIPDDELLEALVAWRNLTLLPVEQRTEERVGKTISSSNAEVLKRVLGLVASADDAVDEAQPLLADLLGVPNPDTDGGSRSIGDVLLEMRLADLPEEQRDTHRDLAVGLAGAVKDKFGKGEYDYDTYVVDWDDKYVHANLPKVGLHSIPYTVSVTGPITLGDPSPVRPRTEYVPRAEAQKTEPRGEEAGSEPRAEIKQFPRVRRDEGLLLRARRMAREERR